MNGLIISTAVVVFTHLHIDIARQNQPIFHPTLYYYKVPDASTNAILRIFLTILRLTAKIEWTTEAVESYMNELAVTLAPTKGSGGLAILASVSVGPFIIGQGRMDQIPKVILHIETSREYGRQLLRGIAKYSSLRGPWSLYREASGFGQSLTSLKNWGATGIITRDIGRIKDIINTGIPTIVSIHFSRSINTPIIVADDVSVGRMAAEHLLERGLRHFGFCGFDDAHWSEARKESFPKRIAEAGFKTHIYRQPRSSARRKWPQEQKELVKWLVDLPKPVGILACNDDRGQHVIEACKVAGLRVPEEIAVVGVDNDPTVCELTDPPLSSVALSVEKAGYEAAELLDLMMKGMEPAKRQIIVHPTHIVARRSSAILAIEDSVLANVLQFIRQNANRAVGVRDVADRVSMSRRTLERRFRKVLRRSIYQQIRYERVERLAQMLMETNLSIGEIATSLDFPSVAHVGRMFHAVKGMSPRAYRARLKGP